MYADLPVGDNLQDLVGIGGFTFLIDPPYSILTERLLSLPVVLNYTVHGGTPMSLAGAVEALAFINTKYANISEDWPDLQYHFAPASDISESKKQYIFYPSIITRILKTVSFGK